MDDLIVSKVKNGHVVQFSVDQFEIHGNTIHGNIDISLSPKYILSYAELDKNIKSELVGHIRKICNDYAYAEFNTNTFYDIANKIKAVNVSLKSKYYDYYLFLEGKL